MNDMQKFVDAMSEMARITRANYHLTLGALIEELGKLPDDKPVVFSTGGSPYQAGSYRGYYSDLAFDSTTEPVTVAQFRAVCQSALGASFEGYKGGDFVMAENTPLWHASYGWCGPAIIGIKTDGDKGVVLLTKQID
jgi:hypothetical protein